MLVKLISIELLTFLTAISIIFGFGVKASSENGENLFNTKGCVACHTIGKGKLTGPDLLGVTKRRNEEWIKKWLKSPDTMVLSDPIAKELLKEYFVPMPNLGLNDNEIESLIEFFEKNDEHLKE